MTVFGSYSKETYTHQLRKEPEQYWKFKYPTAEDEVRAERFLRQSPSATEIFILELALTFAGTSIGGDEPYITEDMPLGVKQAHIGKMPHALILELAEVLNEFVPTWGLARKEEKQEQTD